MNRKSNPFALALAAVITIAAIWPLTLPAAAQAAAPTVVISSLA